MAGLATAVGGRVTDPQRHPAPICWRGTIGASGRLSWLFSSTGLVSGRVPISLQRGLKFPRIDLVMLDGRACSETNGRRNPTEACMSLTFQSFFVRFDHIGARRQKLLETRQAERGRKCHRFPRRANGHDGFAPAGRIRVRSSGISCSRLQAGARRSLCHNMPAA